jgi:hypothetical protein
VGSSHHDGTFEPNPSQLDHVHRKTAIDPLELCMFIPEQFTGMAHRHLLGKGEGRGKRKNFFEKFFVRILMLSIMVKSKFGSKFQFWNF